MTTTNMRFQILALVAYLVAITALVQLENYKVGDPTLKKLYCEMSQQKWKNNDEALDLLKNELAVNAYARSEFNKTMRSNITCPKNLITAECVAVVMYSSNLFNEFNTNMRNGDLGSYKILAALLHSAVVKLSKTFSTSGATVYRGVKNIFELPKEAFHFKQFTSTSLKERVAKNFNGNGKLWKFAITPNSLVANISSISSLPREEEVLISPFQAIQFVNEDKVYINFKTVESKIKCS